MDIRIMLHRTVWVGIASELLVKPSLDIVNYKRSIFRARNEYPTNYCVLCEMAQRCDECPLWAANFYCPDWYGRVMSSSDLTDRFYHAIRCAYFGKYGEKSWLIDGIGDVIDILSLKYYSERITALKRLKSILNNLSISRKSLKDIKIKIDFELSELEDRVDE